MNSFLLSMSAEKCENPLGFIIGGFFGSFLVGAILGVVSIVTVFSCCKLSMPTRQVPARARYAYVLLVLDFCD